MLKPWETPMNRNPQDERTRLLAAGQQLAADAAGEPLSVAAVCAHAGLPVERFAALYPSLHDYHCELVGQLFEEVRDNVARITTNMPASTARLKLALETYLEANISRPRLRELVAALRFAPRGAAVIRKQVSGFTVMIGLELRAVGWPRPEATARLLTAALVEAAQAEHESGMRAHGMRAAVYRYLDSRPA